MVFRIDNPARDTLLLWNGAGIHSDYISLGVRNGNLVFQWNLGEGVGTVTADGFILRGNEFVNVLVSRLVSNGASKI